MSLEVKLADDGETVRIAGRIDDPNVIKAVRRLQRTEGLTVDEAVQKLLLTGVRAQIARRPLDGQRRMR